MIDIKNIEELFKINDLNKFILYVKKNILKPREYLIGEGAYGVVVELQSSKQDNIVTKFSKSTSADKSTAILKNIAVSLYGDMLIEGIILLKLSLTNNFHFSKIHGMYTYNEDTCDVLELSKKGLNIVKQIKFDIYNHDINSFSLNYQNNLATLGNLLRYLVSENNKNLYINVDNIFIQFLVIGWICYKNGVILFDQHLENILIDWIKYDIKYITYKIDNKYLNIPYMGYILNIGDVGSSMIIHQNNYLLAELPINFDINAENTKILSKYKNPTPFYKIMIDNIYDLVPINIIKKTDSYKWWNKPPYDNRSFNYIFSSNWESAFNILKTKYKLSNQPKNKSNIIKIYN